LSSERPKVRKIKNGPVRRNYDDSVFFLFVIIKFYKQHNTRINNNKIINVLSRRMILLDQGKR